MGLQESGWTLGARRVWPALRCGAIVLHHLFGQGQLGWQSLEPGAWPRALHYDRAYFTQLLYPGQDECERHCV